MSKENGGPAFPGSRDVCFFDSGMTLRDWFAGLAMQGMYAEDAEHYKFAQVAAAAYATADAMLAERSKP